MLKTIFLTSGKWLILVQVPSEDVKKVQRKLESENKKMMKDVKRKSKR